MWHFSFTHMSRNFKTRTQITKFRTNKFERIFNNEISIFELVGRYLNRHYTTFLDHFLNFTIFKL